MAGEVVISDADFEEAVTKDKGLVLVDFYADWCMPCRMLAPTIEAIATEYEGRVKVAKLDVDKNPATSEAHSVSGIPTLMLFKAGEPVERLVGLQTADALKAAIDKHLG
ncbi:MAG: thioredoxin [Planctomycetota bacterium]|jgi:thioredoxin 1